MAERWANDGGVARKVRERWINNGGVALKLRERWVNDNGVARCVWRSEQIQISSRTISASARDPVNAGGTFFLNANGFVQIGLQPPASLTTHEPWIVPQEEMAQYECRATGGPVDSGEIGVWRPLSTTRSWNVQQTTTGSTSASITVEIRRIGASTPSASTVIGFFFNVQPPINPQ